MKKWYRGIAYAVLFVTVLMTTVAVLQKVNRLEARKLEGKELLANLRGYIKVGRIKEASSVLESLSGSTFIDQARFEVAEAYVQNNKGEEAIELLDQISLHDRSFDFQRAVLREKIRALFSFFFDPSGDLRTPAQLIDYEFHSRHNPDPDLVQRNPRNFQSPNELLDYFNIVVKQMEDILKIEGLDRSKEPALVESYDAVQILLYGRGLITLEELNTNLAGSSTGSSEQTLYLLGNQFFAEADYIKAFETWGRLAEVYPESNGSLKAFEKTYEMFAGRDFLEGFFQFWPMEKPVWLTEMESMPFYNDAKTRINNNLNTNKDLARYKEITEFSLGLGGGKKTRDKKEITKYDAIFGEEIVEDPVIITELTEGDALDLELNRDHSLGWRLQTEFREFLIRRDGNKIFSPNDEKRIIIQSSYRGKIRFEARKFKTGNDYTEFQKYSPNITETAASLPLIREWTEDLGPLSGNGFNETFSTYVPLTEPGFYLITARARYVPVVAVTQLAIIREKVLIWSSDSRSVFRTVDRETGTPLKDVVIKGTVTPEYNIQKTAPSFFNGTKTDEFLSGLKTGFNKGERDELMTDNDDFIKGFEEGLKLRKDYPTEPQEFSIHSDINGICEVAVPDQWKGVQCKISGETESSGGLLSFDAHCFRRTIKKQWKALFYAERPIVIPGEKIRIKGILREKDNTGIHLPEKKPIEFMVWHGSSLYGVLTDTPNERGTVNLEVHIPPTAAIGSYHLTIGHKYTQYPLFRVDKTEKPLADVKVTVEKDTVIAGSSIRGTVQVRRAGQIPVAGMHVELKVYRKNASVNPKLADYREDFFKEVKLTPYPNQSSDEIYRSRMREYRSSHTFSGKTDSSGNFDFSFDTDRSNASVYLVTARVKTLPKRYTTATAEVLTSTLPVHLKITPDRYYYYPGEHLKAEIETKTLDGKPVSVELTTEITRFTLDKKTVSKGTIQTGKDGKAHISVRMDTREPGIRIGIKGTAGIHYRNVPFSLKKIGTSSRSGDLRLSLDKKAYFPGEEAVITIESDRPGADILILTGRKNIQDMKHITLEGVRGRFTIPITEEHTPNVFFNAQSVWGDRVHKASVEIPIVPTQKFLKIAINTDKEEYKAGQPVRATLTVLDYKDTPVPSAEISLAAVLSAAYTMQEDLTPDLKRYFWNFRLPFELSQNTGYLRSDFPRSTNFWLKPVFAWGIYRDLKDGGYGAGSYGWRNGGGRRRAVGRGGGGYAMSAVTAFADFLRHHGLTLFYESRIITDDTGKAEVTFTLPPRGGEFRFTARALTADTYVGEIRQNVVFKSDITVQAAWPMSIREGERMEIPVFIINNSEKEQKGRLKVSSEFEISMKEPPSFTVKPGSMTQHTLLLNAAALPAALRDTATGIQFPLSFATFTAEAQLESGGSIASKTMVPVHAKGIPFKETSVNILSAKDAPLKLYFKADDKLEHSGLVSIKMLGTPDNVAQWLSEHLQEKTDTHSNTARYYAWAAETTETPVTEAHKSQMSTPLLAAFSRGTRAPSDNDSSVYYLTFASAKKRGVFLPEEWVDYQYDQDMKQAGKLGAKELWALAEITQIKEDKIMNSESLRFRLEDFYLYNKSKKTPCDNEYLALAYKALGRDAKADNILKNELANVFEKRRVELDEISLEKASALLLAGVRCSIDTTTTGIIYSSLLKSLSRTPDPSPWDAALAVHAVHEWGKKYKSAVEPIVLTVNGTKQNLEPGKELQFKIKDKDIRILISAPQTGTVAVQTSSQFRIDNPEDEYDNYDCRISRIFARVDSHGNAELLPDGGKVRIGESVIMYTLPNNRMKAPVVVPTPGPWTAVGVRRNPKPVKRVLDNWILNPQISGEITQAIDNRNYDSAKDKLKKAVLESSFLEEWVECDNIPAVTRTNVSDENPGIYRDGGPTVMAVRPDRLGTYIAPGVYIRKGNTLLPAAWTKDFTFTVVPEHEQIPALEIEKTADPILLKAASATIDYIDRDFFENYFHSPDNLLENPDIEGSDTNLNIREFIIRGLAYSSHPEAAEAFIRFLYLENGVSLELLFETQDWVDSYGPRLNSYNFTVLNTVLKRRDFLERLAVLMHSESDAETIPDLYYEIIDYISAENSWRGSTVSPDSDYPYPEKTTQKDFLAALGNEKRMQLFTIFEEETIDIKRKLKEYPSFHSVLTDWAENFTFTLNIDEAVPDLEIEEYKIDLPGYPSLKELNQSLRLMGLKCTRTDDVLTVTLHPVIIKRRPVLKAIMNGHTPEERIKAWASTIRLAWSKDYRGGWFKYYIADQRRLRGYVPRIEIDPKWFFSLNPVISNNRPLLNQKYALRNQGVKMEIVGSVLRFSPLNPHSSSIYINNVDDMGTPVPVSVEIK